MLDDLGENSAFISVIYSTVNEFNISYCHMFNLLLISMNDLILRIFPQLLTHKEA